MSAAASDLDEEQWCAERREEVAAYLARQVGLVHGAIGEWPAWHIEPYVSIWAIESVANPGSVGWWAICGDLPTDYCSGGGCPHPRLALESILGSWRAGLEALKPGDTVIGATGLPASVESPLRARIELLDQCLRDDGLWED